MRLYILGVMGAAIAALPAAAVVRENLRPGDEVLLVLVVVMATAAQLRPVHISPKVKLTVEDTVTFVAALIVGPLYAMVAAGASSLIAQHVRGLRTRWYNRGFNTATSMLSTGAAATSYLVLADPTAPIVNAPIAILVAGVTKYFVHTTLVDLVVALQLRRSPLVGWWHEHRRLLPYEAALLILGALAAIAADSQPWTLVLFAAPMAIVLFTLRDSAQAREQTRSAVIEMADLIDARDLRTRGRSQRVAVLAERLARRIKLDNADVDVIRYAARVQDIGRMGTNDLMRLGPGPLIEAEERELRRHPELGHRILKHLGLTEEAEVVLTHHERYDGRGYPRGLVADKVPIAAGVISIADAYDEMTSGRPYRDRLDWDAVRGALIRQRGRQWRDTLVDAFIEMLEEERRAARIEPASTPVNAVVPKPRALP